MPRRLAHLLFAGALLGGLLTLGCTGDDEGASRAEPTETPTPTGTLTAASPADLTSYRYSVDVSLLPSVLDVSEAPEGLPLDAPIRIVINGERVSPDREHAKSSADMGFLQLDTETIVVGDQRWLREGNGSWKEGATSGLESFAGLDFRPSVLFADDQGQYDILARKLEDYEWVEEDVDGIPARHFALDEGAFFELFQQEHVLPIEVNAALTADIWLARDLGTPIRLLVVGTNAADDEVVRLELTLRDLNAEDITVQAPS